MPGVAVYSSTFAGGNDISFMALTTPTDAQGRFRLLGLPKGQGNRLILVTKDDQPYFMQEDDVPDTPGIGPISIEVTLHRSICTEGRGTEGARGEPVAKGVMRSLPFRENTFAQAVPEFRTSGRIDGSLYHNRYQTKLDGTYRFVGLPGRAM